jgi:hypothetical protein
VSFAFDLAMPPRDRAKADTISAAPARRLISTQPIPARPLTGPPPSGPVPIGIAASPPPPLPRKQQPWTMAILITLVTVAALASAVTLVLQIVRNG